MIFVAYLLPWLVGTLLLILLETIWLEKIRPQEGITKAIASTGRAHGQRYSSAASTKAVVINWPRALGYGFFLGYFICAILLYLVHAYTGQLSVELVVGLLITLCLLSWLLIWWQSRRSEVQWRLEFPVLSSGGWWLVVLFFGLILLHLVLAFWDASSRPLMPWDAWTTWTYRAKIWFFNQDLSPMVSSESWLASQDPGTYNLIAHTYSPIVSLIQLWPVQVYGYWSDSLAIMPGLLAGIALALGLYGQGKSLKLSPVVVLAATYMLLSVPLLGAHMTLPGYADAWLSGFAGLGFVALLHWSQSSRKSQLLVGLLFLLLGVWIKREGSIWLLAGMLFVLIRLLPWPLLLAIVLGGLVAVLSGHAVVQLPMLGSLGYADGVLYLGQQGSYPLQLQNVASAVGTNLFFHASWNLLFFYLLTMLGLPLTSKVRWSLLWFLLLISGMLAGIFFFSAEGRWAQDYSALNRIALQMLPAFLYALMIFWQALFPAQKLSLTQASQAAQSKSGSE